MSAYDAPLDRARLERALAPGVAVHVRERVDSTNDAVRRVRADAADRASMLVAGTQELGRGRLGRRWHSPPGGGVYLSLLVRPRVPADGLARWTLGAGVAVCRALERCGIDDVALEWPNDLVVDGRKLGGVLAEVRTQGAEVAELILGVGINLAPVGSDADAEVRRRAISIEELRHAPSAPDRETVIIAVVRELLSIVALLERGAWHEVEAAWLERSLDAPGRRVEVAGDRGWQRGVTNGLGPGGALLVRHDDGREIAVRLAGSVRALEH